MVKRSNSSESPSFSFQLLSGLFLSSCFCIKGSALLKLTKGGSGGGHLRYFQLMPSRCLLAWHEAEPQLVLGALPGLSAAARKAHKPSLEARGRAFRFVLAHVEVDVVAPTVAVREHWLLACRSLPLGGAFVGRVSVATAYEEAGSPGVQE